MTLSSPDTPPDDVPEADWAEQTLDADPLAEARPTAGAARERRSGHS